MGQGSPQPRARTSRANGARSQALEAVIGGLEMSDTPETDKLLTDWMRGVTKDLPNFVEISRRLERERDEAREIAYDLANNDSNARYIGQS